MCGWGGDVNPGRNFIQGHNQKHGAPAKYQSVIATKSVLKVKHRKKRRRTQVVATWYAKNQVIKSLQKRALDINHLIELLQEVL